MCGRYAQTLPPEAIQSLFGTRNLIESVPRYNIAPTQPVIAIWEESGHRDAKLARWGLVPHWVKDPREFPLVINARAETMATKPTFRDALRHQRCIVPASGYYEWQVGKDGTKRPFYIRSANDAPLAMAGLFATWMGPNGEEIDSVAIVTVPANADVAHVHNRMPALLGSTEVDGWLDVRGAGASEASALIRPARAGMLAAHAVSRRVNSAANEGVDLIAPATEDAEAAGTGKSMKVKAKKSDQLDLF